MNRVRGMIVCAGVTLGLSTGLALALPPVLEKAPKGAMFVIAVPSVEKFEKSIQSLTTAAEIPFPLPGIEDLLAMGGISGGLDLSKSMAMVFMPPAGGAEAANAEDMQGEMIVMLPVSDYAAFLQNFNAKPGDAGSVDAVNINGEDTFARNVGDGYAIISPSRELVTAFKMGNPTAKADMGKVGERIADTADLVAVINMSVARPFIERGMKVAQDRMADQMAMMGMDGEGGDADAPSPVMDWLTKAMVADAKVMVGGMKAGGLGASFEMAASFNEGSMMGKAFGAAGNAGALLSKLPTTQYLLAAAIDTSSPAVKRVLADMAAKAKESMPADAPQLFAPDGLAEADGHAVVIGMNPTMLMGGGVLTNSVAFSATREPAKLVATARKNMETLNGKSFGGMTYEASFKDDAAKVGETSVDVWQVKMQSDGGDGMNSQAASMLFGPQGGPGGYLAEVDGGVMRTFAKNSVIMAAAMKSASGGENLTSDTLMKQVGGQLPSGRIIEAYIGTKNIVDMIVPMATMMGVQIDPESIPAQLPPLGFGVAGEGGSAHFALFFPAPVLKTMWVLGEGLAPQIEEMGGFGADPEMEEEEAGAEEPAGQPRF